MCHVRHTESIAEAKMVGCESNVVKNHCTGLQCCICIAPFPGFSCSLLREQEKEGALSSRSLFYSDSVTLGATF